MEIFGEYEIDDSRERVDLDRVHSWLASTYWSPDVPRETIERAWKHSSAVIGAYHDSGQVGYMRIVSDRATFAWLCDVFVDPGTEAVESPAQWSHLRCGTRITRDLPVPPRNARRARSVRVCRLQTHHQPRALDAVPSPRQPFRPVT